MYRIWRKELEILLYIILVMAISLSITGFKFPGANNIFHIPIALNEISDIDENIDPFRVSLSNYTSLFWSGISLIVNKSNIENVFFSFFLLSKFLFILSFYYFIVHIAGNTPISLGLSMLVILFPPMFEYSVLGRNEISINYLSHSQLVIPFVLVAFGLLIRERIKSASILLGLAFNINAFISSLCVLVIGIVIIVNSYKHGLRTFLHHSISSALLFLIFASPTLIWIANSTLSVPEFLPYNFIDYLRTYYPYHYFVDVQWDRALFTLSEVLLIYVILHLLESYVEHRKIKQLKLIYISISLILIIGASLPYLTDSRLLIALHFLRIDTFLYLFLCALLVTLAAKSWYDKPLYILPLLSLLVGDMFYLSVSLIISASDGNVISRFYKSIIVLTILLLSTYFSVAGKIFTAAGVYREELLMVTSIYCFAAVASGLGNLSINRFLLITLLFMKSLIVFSNPIFDKICILTTTLSVIVYLISINRSDKIYWSFINLAFTFIGYMIIILNITWKLKIIFLVFLSIYVVLYYISSNKWRYFFVENRMLLLKFLFIPILCLASFQLYQYGGFDRLSAKEKSWVDIQIWSKYNTSPEKIFLAGRNKAGSSFATLSNRAVWVDWKIGAAVMWSPEYYWTWWPRYKEVTGLKTFDEYLKYSLSRGIHYLVFEWQDTTELYGNAILYTNQHYQLVDVTAYAKRQAKHEHH